MWHHWEGTQSSTSKCKIYSNVGDSLFEQILLLLCQYNSCFNFFALFVFHQHFSFQGPHCFFFQNYFFMLTLPSLTFLYICSGTPWIFINISCFYNAQHILRIVITRYIGCTVVHDIYLVRSIFLLLLWIHLVYWFRTVYHHDRPPCPADSLMNVSYYVYLESLLCCLNLFLNLIFH